MSLFKQLFIAICLLMLVNFAGSFLVGVESSREQQVSQLRSHAQDAATALGLSLGAHIEDPAMVELMVSSIFDSGYFESIRVVDQATGEVMVERSGVPISGVAPQWFVGLVGLRPAMGDAYVSDGWRQAARVEVVSHPLFAIGKLWQGALGSLLWLALSSVLCVVLGGLFLKRQLRPLDYMVEQSKAIARREFLSLPQLPKTPEFRRVVSAMNQMVEKLKALFAEEAARSEKLRDEAYKDALTGLANRRHFDMQLHNRLSGEDLASSGYLFLLQLHDLATLNQSLGGQRTDRLLAEVAEQLKKLAQGRYPLARNRGGEFAVLGLGLQREEAEQVAGQVLQALEHLRQTLSADCELSVYVGITPFAAGDSLSSLYQGLDQALTAAMSSGPNALAFSSQQGSSIHADQTHHWHELLDAALKQRRFQLYFQPVLKAGSADEVWHYKVLARLPDADGELLPASVMLPWLERFGWMARLDLSMLEQAFDHLRQHRHPIAVSISSHLLRDNQLLEQLYRVLEKNKELAGFLTLELDEDQLPAQSQLESMAERLHALGFGLALQHFGGRFSMIGNLARLGLNYLKVDGSYIRAIDQEDDKKLFIEAMQRAASSIDLPLIAERVESEGEWRVLSTMGIAGVQGRLFGEPAPWR